MKRAIFYAILGTVAAILHAAAQTGPILETVHNGGPAWLLWFLFLPLLDFAGGIAMAALHEHWHYNARSAPVVPQWHQWEEEVRAARDPVDSHFDEIAMALLETPWHLNLAGKPAVIPPRQREGEAGQ